MASSSLYAEKEQTEEARKYESEQEDNKSICQRYEELMSSSLPKKKGWLTDHFYQYRGFWYEPMFGVGVMWANERFKARPSDVVLATFPKCGTTWLKALMFAIANRNRYHDSANPLLFTNPHECVPYIELQAYKDNPTSHLNSLSSPRLLSTHIPYTSLPNSIISFGSKIVCVSRNPKDVFVSMWLFARSLKQKDSPPLPLEEAFESFCGGVCLSGPFWDYVLEYWKAGLECPDKVLFLKYEDMKKDPFFYIKILAEFMGHPFSFEEEKRGAIDEITKLCSLENLSSLEVNKTGTFNFGFHSHAKVPNSMFFRRGKVGGSKNHLTAEMLQRLDQITEQKLGGSGLKL